MEFQLSSQKFKRYETFKNNYKKQLFINLEEVKATYVRYILNFCIRSSNLIPTNRPETKK